MARYRGPRTKKSRSFGESIFGDHDKSFERRSYGPGQHGNSRRRRQQSEYAVQLKEKQKAKYTYGVLERQFRNMFDEANAKAGVTGEILLQMLESRLDNVVYRMGIAPSRRGARQLVSHKHITVNGSVVNIPSYRLNPGDSIEVRERSKSLDAILESVAGNRANYPWIEFDIKKLGGTFVNVPERENIPENIKEQLIVELYSK